MRTLQRAGLLCMLCSTTVWGALVLHVQPAATNTTVGSSFAVNIGVTGALDLAGYQFDLAFDSAKLSVTSVTEGSFFPGGGLWSPGTNNGSGTISLIFNAFIGPGGIDGNGVLASILFQALTAGTSPVTILNELISDSGGGAINLTVANGTVNIGAGGGGGVPEPGTGMLLISSLGALVFLRNRRVS